MKYELWYSVVVRDRHGKVVSRERRRSKSFLKAWNEIIYIQCHYAGTVNITDTGNTVRAIPRHATNLTMNAPAGNINYGIRVGTGNTPVAIDDYALETPIAEGTGAGQMEHLVCTVATSVVAAPSCSFLVSRTIVNNSGGLITVREAGIYMFISSFVVGDAVRDVLVAPQAVPNGGSITIDWTIKVTV
ncbi:hypothetical protein ES703_86798 [subsurface metagenome]